MPPAFVQSNNTGSGTGATALAFTNPVGASSMLLLILRLTTVTVAPNPTDGMSNSWLLVGTTTNGTSKNYIFYVKSAAAGATTVAFGGSFSFSEAIVAEYTGVNNNGTYGGANGTGTTATSPSISTTSGDLIIGTCSNESANGLTLVAGSGYTLRTSANGNVGLQDKISGGGSVTSDIAQGSSVNWDAQVANFNGVSASSKLPVICIMQ